MHKYSNESGEIFSKNVHAQTVQTNAATEERFQSQSRNNATAENNK